MIKTRTLCAPIAAAMSIALLPVTGVALSAYAARQGWLAHLR